MLTELILGQAVESVVGYGFSEVIRAVFARSKGASDREMIDQMVHELRRHGVQISDIDLRLARFEALLEATVARIEANAVRVSAASAPAIPSYPARAQSYCKWCGAIPGPSTKCPIFEYTGHSWTPMQDMYCKWCGAVPGKATKCPIFKYIGHSWTSMRATHCKWCGAVPGEATKCPTFPHTGHSWK